MYSENDNGDVTKLKDIDDGIRQQILDLLGKSSEFRVSGKLKDYYVCLRELFYRIEPFDFQLKDQLNSMTEEVNSYLEELGGRPVDASHKFQLAEKGVEFDLLIDEYKRLVIHALKSLGLYLKIIRRVDDPDEQFSLETFDVNDSLLDKKKDEIIKSDLGVIDLIKCLTSRQLHDVYARWLLRTIK